MEKIKIGTIFNTHGLKGEVKVKSFSDFNSVRFKKGTKLFLQAKTGEQEVVIKTYREHKGIVLVTFEGYEDINLVECFKGDSLWIARDQMKDDGEGYYFFDLIGCQVYDQNETLLGTVEDILETGAKPILRINKTILIPFVDAFIKNVDIDQKMIHVEVIEGLL